MELRPGIKITLIRNSGMTWVAWVDNGRKYPEHIVGNFGTANEAVDALLERVGEA